MSKKTNVKAIEMATKALNKKGKFKGSNKKETRYLRDACPHHIITGKGNIKPKFFNTHDGWCRCTMCKQRIPTKILDKAEIKEKCAPVKEYMNQAVVAAIGGNLGDKVINNLIAAKVALNNFSRVYPKIAKSVSKADRAKKKKNRKKNSNGSEQYGGWKTNR